MKVVKIINSLGFGGIERVFEIAAEYYSGKKDDLLFIALGFGGAAEQSIRSFGFRVIVLNSKTRIPNIRLIHKVYKILRSEKPDVVHTCGAEGNFHGLLAARLANVPVRIGEEIGIPSHSALAKRIFKVVYQTASAVIVVARAVQEYLLANKEVDEGKLRIIYNPVDIARFEKPRSLNNDNYIVLAVCRLTSIKNLKALIKVFKRLSDNRNDAVLWIVGEGEDRPALQGMVKELQLEKKVVFWGYQADPAPYYSQASVFVLPSFSEGHPVSLIEAMIAGVPSIVTKVGGAAEIVTDGLNGWLVDPYDEEDIFRKMSSVMSLDQFQLDQITSRAKEGVVGSFSPEEYLNRLNVLYKGLLK